MVETVSRSIQKRESRNTKIVRPYLIDPANETIIELRGITDFNWERLNPMLDKLRESRSQTESEELQITPIPFTQVKKLFPNISKQSIFRLLRETNDSLAPNGWSIIRVGEEDMKPFDAPWFLRGPNDNGLQSARNPKYVQPEKTGGKTAGERKKEIAEKRFDRTAFENLLLLQCVTNLSNPDAKKSFTNDPVKVMTSVLTTDVRLQRIIGDEIPPLEFFKKSIEAAINRMAGKHIKELPSETQRKIVEPWNKIRKDFKQHPKTVIFDHFSRIESI